MIVLESRSSSGLQPPPLMLLLCVAAAVPIASVALPGDKRPPNNPLQVTGMYFHNIKQAPGSGRTGACMHTDDLKVQDNTFAKYLAPAGYKVGLFGKYLNNWDFEVRHCPFTVHLVTCHCLSLSFHGAAQVVPQGFDAWLANGGGDYFGPQFQTKDAGGGIPDGSYTFPLVNYTTSVVGNMSIEFIRKVVASKSGPFFACECATAVPFSAFRCVSTEPTARFVCLSLALMKLLRPLRPQMWPPRPPTSPSTQRRGTAMCGRTAGQVRSLPFLDLPLHFAAFL